MAVMAGYKQTEVGVIPVDWEVRKLGEVATFRTGPFGSALHKSDYTNDGVPVINPMHIINGRIVPSQRMTITESAATKLSEYRLKPNEIVIGRRGDMGRCAVVKHEHFGWLCGTGSMIVRPSSGVDAGFLQRVLSSPSVVSAIEDTSVGTTMINLNQATLSGLVIQAPPLREQEAIAGALSDVDALIEALEQLIAKKRHLKQGAMQELLTGQKRLPGFSGEWVVKRLGDIAKFYSGGTPPTAIVSYYGGDIPWITSGDLNKSAILEVGGRITKPGLENSSAKMIEENTLLIALYGATSGVTAISKIKAAINQAVLAIIPKNDSSTFLFFKLSYLKDWIISTYTQGGQPNLSGDIVKSIEITLPIVEEQTAIATILSDMDTEIAVLESRLAKTRSLKQGMMHNLLTGKIRLM